MPGAGVLWLVASAAVIMGQSSTDPASLVDPMIGTAHFGYTFPGAVVPFGMVSFSPNLLSAAADKRNTPGGYIYTGSVALPSRISPEPAARAAVTFASCPSRTA